MAVVFDAVGPDSAGASGSGSTTTLSWSHTCDASASLLVVGITVGRFSTPPSITSVTYNGVAMTSLDKQVVDSGLGYVQLYYLLDPDPGTNTVLVTRGSATNTFMQCGSLSFIGAGSVGTASKALAKSTTVTGTAADSMIVGTFVAGNTISTSVGGGQTIQWRDNQENTNTDGGNGAQTTSAGGGDIALSFNTSSGHYAIMGVEIIAAPSTPPATSVSYVGSTIGSEAIGSSTTIAIPSGTITNDVIVIAMQWYFSAPTTVTWPSGFTQVGTLTSIVNGAGTDVYSWAWKRSSSGEGSGNYTVSWSGANNWNQGFACAVRGTVTSGNPYEDAQISTDTAVTSESAVSVTTTANDFLLHIIATDGENNTAGTYTPPTGYTQIISGPQIGASYLIDSGGGTRTASGGSIENATSHDNLLIAFKAAYNSAGNIGYLKP